MTTATEQPTGAKLRNMLRRAHGKSYEIQTVAAPFAVYVRSWAKHGHERLYVTGNGAEFGYLDILADGLACPSQEGNRRALDAALAAVLADPTNRKQVTE